MGNSDNPIKTLDVEGCPASLKLELQKMKEQFLSAMDLNKIPRINFDMAKISVGETCRFMRVDLKWQNVVWSFIRIQNNPEDNHARIYYGLLDEIAERSMLTRRDIKDLMSNPGGGFLGRSGVNKIEVWGTTSYSRGEPNHELTKNILREELGCQVG